MSTDRRTFLKLLGVPAIAASLPADIAKLLAMSAQGRAGTIADVEPIVRPLLRHHARRLKALLATPPPPDGYSALTRKRKTKKKAGNSGKA